MKNIGLCCLILLLFVNFVEARHIIGGEVTYVCNGNGNYTFFIEVYRDCNSGGADFDNPARVTMYRQTGNQYNLLNTFSIGLDGNDITVPPDGGPCIEPINVCVGKNSYSFSMDLPAGNDSYHLVYQRCCRNNSISNLIDPGSQGATYTIELTPEAQAVCNNSPSFDAFPPTVICANEPIDFAHGATDVDGDQLIYKFCTPLIGGGLDGSPQMPNGIVTSCTGVAPDPGCPPPFTGVNFAQPTYTPLEPMGGSPTVTINPSTGFITGVPTLQGQYVVGVCVEEYRNGVLLSVVRRDFQFNVTGCNPLVDARIDANEIINGNEFIVNSCGSSFLIFDNQSLGQNFVEEFYWEFDLDGDNVVEQYTDWNLAVDFPGLGTYTGLLVLNPGETCTDTAIISVNVYPDITTNFSFSYDTCVSGPVAFVDESITEASTIQEWSWDFGDGNSSMEQNPEHLYDIPGFHEVSLTIMDENGCEETFSQTVKYFPAPAVVIVEPSTFLGCQPATIFFNNLSTPIDDSYDIVWDFGDGTTSGEISPSHFYEDLGVYDISLEITSPLGCFASESWDSWIEVLPSPTAAFTYNPRELNIFDNTANFVDESIEPAVWDWRFGDAGFSIDQNPSFAFPDSGSYEVQLVVTHESGCTDTTVQILDVMPEVRYFLPNAFTPNNDDINDFFVGNGILGGMTNFRLDIWNRWGELIFETNDPSQGWNGRKRNTGKLSPNGVYIYLASYTGPRGEFVELKGYATLIR